ncbi:MAG: sigma factor, partial [Myxococcota bacterium]
MAKDTPEEWFARHARGEPGAFEQLVGHYHGPIQAYLARCGLNAIERDDLSQEIFLRLHASAARYHPSRPARVWV